ncbi:MAG: biotin--[Bacteroidales bacterium]|nr:biotin--[acetyl-CoA-carboxylase] ligase [Bacteroidales bacterium]
MESKTRIKWFDSLDSTNDELLRHLPTYDNLSVVAAVEQFAGRGQRGNRWLSEPGDNLTFSLLLRPDRLPAREIMSITFLAAVVIRDWLREEGVPALVKWPNDLYVGNRKICGMLIENGFAEGMVAWSVIGIGINLNQIRFPGELVNPVSLKRITGKEYDPESALERICQLFEIRLSALSGDRERLYEAYCEELFQAGVPRPYRDLLTGEEFTGTIKGVTREGRLLMDRDGMQVSFAFKEVGYIL